MLTHVKMALKPLKNIRGKSKDAIRPLLDHVIKLKSDSCKMTQYLNIQFM